MPPHKYQPLLLRPKLSNRSAPAAPAGPAKIAVVAFQVAVAQTNEGQRNFADLQKKYDPKRQQLKALSDEVDNLTKQLQTQGDKLSDTERASRAKTIDDKKKQLQREAEDAQNDMQQEMQELYNGLASKVYDVLASYAQQHGYTLVLDVAQQQTPVLVCDRIHQHHQGRDRRVQREVGRARSADQPRLRLQAPCAQGPGRPLKSGSQSTERPRFSGTFPSHSKCAIRGLRIECN